MKVNSYTLCHSTQSKQREQGDQVQINHLIAVCRKTPHTIALLPQTTAKIVTYEKY